MERAPDWFAATPLPALRTALAAVEPDDADAVAALVRPLLDDVRWLEQVIAEFVAQAMRDPWFRPPLAAFETPVLQGMLLYSDQHVALFVGCGARDKLADKRLATRGGSIVIPGTLGLMRVLRCGDALLSFWEGGWHEGRIRPTARAIGDRRLVDGETVTVDGRSSGFIVEHVGGDMALLQATIYTGATPTLCEYDVATLALGGTGAALDGASRAQLLATLLAELGHDDPAALAIASRRPESFARWFVMRQWVSNWPDTARPRLVEMAAEDPDAELRDLAASTLALIDATEEIPCHA